MGLALAGTDKQKLIAAIAESTSSTRSGSSENRSKRSCATSHMPEVRVEGRVSMQVE